MNKRSPITTHILDLSKGKPAAQVEVILEHMKNNAFHSVAIKKTNSDGRIEDLLEPGSKAQSGLYRLTFDTGLYFGKNTFYPTVQIIFEVKNPDEHYHVPLLLSPFGYSTYRGS